MTQPETHPDIKTEVYRRTDDRWAWRAIAGNGQVIATDGGQGFENRTDAVDSAARFGTVTVLEAEL